MRNNIIILCSKAQHNIIIICICAPARARGARLSEENLNGMHLNALKKGFRVIIFRFSSENEFASIIKIDMNSSKHEDHIEHKKSRK